MPRTAKALTDAAVRKLKHPRPDSNSPPVTHLVGGTPGLLLQITASGARSWLLRASIGGKVRHAGLGRYADVSLAEARDAARKAHQAIREGRDPIAERQAAKRALREAVSRALTFAEAARKYHRDVKAPALRSERSREGWIRGLEKHAFPIIGSIPVDEIELRHILAVLEPIWPKPHATYLRGNIEAVLEWSAVRGYRQKGDNPARWNTLKHVLTAPGKAHRVSHLPALPWQESPAFMTELRTLDTPAAQALQFLILTAARSGEVRKATWEEIDIAGKLWTAPASHMKGGLTHRVPLSDPAIKLLEALPHREGLLFSVPGRGRKKGTMRPLHDFELSALSLGRRVKINGRGEWVLTDDEDGKSITVHGHRSALKDWSRICTNYADEVSELALAHVSTDATRSAYARDELLDKRSRLMSEWAKYLERGPAKAATVTKIGSKMSARST